MWALHQESSKELDESCEEDAEVIFNEIDVKLKVAAIHVERQQEEKVRHYSNHLRRHPYILYIHTVHTYIHTFMYVYISMSAQYFTRYIKTTR